MRQLGLVVMFVALAVAGCGRSISSGGDAIACTQIGCTNGVTVAVTGVGLPPGRGVLEAEICFDGQCEQVRYMQQRNGGARWDNQAVEMFVSDKAVEVTLRLPEGDYDTTTNHDVSLVLRMRGEPPISVEREIPLERSQPNGPDCPPVCWQARVEHAA